MFCDSEGGIQRELPSIYQFSVRREKCVAQNKKNLSGAAGASEDETHLQVKCSFSVAIARQAPELRQQAL